jgi:guanylate kinase
MLSFNRRGVVLVLSSPSGAGKTSIVKALLKQDSNLSLSVSVTTRPPRKNEVNGVDYMFVSKEEFDQLVSEQGFFEHAKVFGNYYGTLKQPIMEKLDQGQDVILDIDWQGTQQLSQHLEREIIKVFILPPSYQALYARLTSRGLDDTKIIHNRMQESISEISHWAEYDYVVINDDFELTINNVLSILRGERLKRHRQIWISEFVNNLSLNQELIIHS